MKKRTYQWIGLGIVVGLLVVLSLVVDPSRLLDPDALRADARANVWQSAGLFLLGGIAIKLLFVPYSPISLVGGLVFGGVLGGALAFVVLLTSSVIGFAAGRKLGRGIVEDWVDDEESKLGFVEKLLRKHGLLAVIVLRVVPTLPLSAINMLLGHSSVRARDFVLGTAIGILPGSFILAFLGNETLEPFTGPFWIFAALTGLLVVGGILGGLALRRRVQT